MTNKVVDFIIAVIGLVLMFAAFFGFFWWLDSGNREMSRLTSQCVVEQNKPVDWCWYWANAQRWK